MGRDDRVLRVNYAALQFFLKSEAALLGQTLADLFGKDHKILTYVEDAQRHDTSFASRDVRVNIHPGADLSVDLKVHPIADQPGVIFISLEPNTMRAKMSGQLATQNSARAAKAVAAMLAHEIKNPLSGIRGAAQLISEELSIEDAALTQLIVKETDRIVALVDEMEVFSDDRPLETRPQNIHQVLDHALALARNGFAAHHSVEAGYDPSLPEIDANWNQLVQAFLNLLKNASEAAPKTGGVIQVQTAYSHGTKIKRRGSDAAIDLPIEICVSDNGPGVSAELSQSIFDPFVTDKAKGKGLGLALVSKIIDSHCGLVSYERKSGRTLFRILLPAAPSTKR